MKIWLARYRINEYNQPADDPVVAIWVNKPPIEVYARTIGCTFPGKDDKETLAIVQAWTGVEGETSHDLFHYLECMDTND